MQFGFLLTYFIKQSVRSNMHNIPKKTLPYHSNLNHHKNYSYKQMQLLLNRTISLSLSLSLECQLSGERYCIISNKRSLLPYKLTQKKQEKDMKKLEEGKWLKEYRQEQQTIREFIYCYFFFFFATTNIWYMYLSCNILWC